jgi:hypothetical protein
MIPRFGLSRSIIINTTSTIKKDNIRVGIYALFDPRPAAYPMMDPVVINIMNRRNRIISGTCRFRMAFLSPLASITSFKADI